MRILIAPLEFKGSLSAGEAAGAIARGLRLSLPHAVLIERAMADGGPGTLDAILSASSGERREAVVSDPFGRPIRAEWGWVHGEAAVVETAQAAGLSLLAAGERDPEAATSRGAGELVAAALDAGSKRIFLGLGGSATNDGGRGFLEALGAGFKDEPGGGILADVSGLHPGLANCELIALSDVRSPLLGAEGATRVYAEQKGATPEMLDRLERRMQSFARAAEAAFGLTVKDQPGAGAAGGLGFACLLLEARLLPGAEVIARLLGIDEEIKTATALVTGEGAFDSQTNAGKGVATLVELARRAHVPAYGVFGRVGADTMAFTSVYALEELAGSTERAISSAAEYLEEAGRRLGEQLRSIEEQT
ncbi:MAG: glycerate kinase [Dehalococcoidia bacterium]